MCFPPIVFICYLLIFSSLDHSVGQSEKNMNLEVTFVSWNRSTLSSIKNRIRKSNNIPEKKIYENRLAVFKGYLDIKYENSINRQSIRFLFLKKLKEKQPKISDFFIIEANRSGESLEIKNYILQRNSKGLLMIDVYVHTKEHGWLKSGQTTEARLCLDLIESTIKYGSGFNHDDVIVTKFTDNKIINSQYYIHMTLSTRNPLKNILSY